MPVLRQRALLQILVAQWWQLFTCPVFFLPRLEPNDIMIGRLYRVDRTTRFLVGSPQWVIN
jgi:hypothetical protein